MKAIGGLLLVLGIIGLLLNLILWLPSKFNLIVVVLVSVVCLVAIWGGGRLSQPKTDLVPEPAKQYEPMSQPAQWSQPAVAAVRAWSLIVLSAEPPLLAHQGSAVIVVPG
jgi:hypothetical protein